MGSQDNQSRPTVTFAARIARNSMVFRVQHLFIYPIKSLGGISMEMAELSSRGLKWDRRMMLIDWEGKFITQRENPHLALFKTELVEERLRIFGTGIFAGESIEVPLEPLSGEEIEVTVWSESVKSQIVSNEANEFFSNLMGFEIRLVFMPENSNRHVDENYANGAIQAFADAFPILMIGTASLDDLNKRLLQNGSPEIMGWERFRPNLVITTEAPFEEDLWKSMDMNKLKFRIVKACSRCVLITVNQQTGEKGAEPLRTLAKYRTMDNKVLFGQNVVNEAHSGFIKVNDPVSIT